jgi:hypothetical protein
MGFGPLPIAFDAAISSPARLATCGAAPLAKNGNRAAGDRLFLVFDQTPEDLMQALHQSAPAPFLKRDFPRLLYIRLEILL